MMIWGAEVTRGGVREVGTCGAGAHCGGAEAGAGMLGAGTGEAIGRLICSFAALWSCCWPMTRVVNTLSMATALTTMTRRCLFDCAQ
jgi:hypothetical protein